jgi:hypothetical protein
VQALVRRWRKCIANGGDRGTMVFCNWQLALSNGVTVHPVSVIVSVEINRRHTFRAPLVDNDDDDY